MNDLIFVMCNLKLNDNQVKKQVDDFGVVDDLSSDDVWTIKGEKHSNFDLLGAIDSATRRKNGKEDESDEEEIPNDAEMKSHDIKDDLEIQIDNNLENSRSFELNNIDNIGVGTSSSTNVHNIGVDISSDTNNPLDDIYIDECLRNNEQDEDNEASFSLHDILANCLLMKNYLNYV
jgi:hypothetical protein